MKQVINLLNSKHFTDKLFTSIVFLKIHGLNGHVNASLGT